jgi:hypothetical protein
VVPSARGQATHTHKRAGRLGATSPSLSAVTDCSSSAGLAPPRLTLSSHGTVARALALRSLRSLLVGFHYRPAGARAAVRCLLYSAIKKNWACRGNTMNLKIRSLRIKSATLVRGANTTALHSCIT